MKSIARARAREREREEFMWTHVFMVRQGSDDVLGDKFGSFLLSLLLGVVFAFAANKRAIW